MFITDQTYKKCIHCFSTTAENFYNYVYLHEVAQAVLKAFQ